MELIITTFGSYLHRDGEMFEIKNGDQKHQVSARKVRSIAIATGATLSTNAIRLAIEKNIDIIFLDSSGQPYGRIWHGRPGSTTAIRRQQLRIADTADGFSIAVGWLIRKSDNQIDFLKNAAHRRPQLKSKLLEYVVKLESIHEKISTIEGDLELQRSTLMGYEGRAGRSYWEAISLLLPEKFRFNGRSRNPAQDEFNCLLNYAYGVLYGTVERACLMAGIDPYVGFIHTDHYQKKSLVFDLIECYRIWADETVVALFAARQVKKDMFDKLENGFRLNKEGKAVLMSRFGTFLDEGVRYRGRNIKRRDIVQFDCHQLANRWIETPS